jgi:acetyltransferase-like isoleucine patch superfamily enzyme
MIDRIQPKLENFIFQAKFFCLRMLGKQNVVIEDNCRLYFSKNISIGNHVYINHHAEFIAKTSIQIGNYVSIGQNCLILTSNKKVDRLDIPIKKQGEELKPVAIEDNVWIGAGVTILAGVKIGHDSVVGAGAVVTKDVAPYAIVGGVPAKVLKWRK